MRELLQMRCDFYALILSIIASVATSPFSNATELAVPDDDSSVSSTSPATALSTSAEVLNTTEQSTAASTDITGRIGLDCNVQRKKSLLKKANGLTAIYVPTCSPTNAVSYLAVQCLETLKYCWCVHTDTGEPIPGTSLMNAMPHCEDKKPQQISKKHRKRCLGRKRLRFLRRLVSTIKAEMIMTGNTVAENVGRDAAVRWKFRQLDVNKDQVLERNEWKPYKYAIIQWKKVKHCSRNLFKTCDTDSNSRLTTDEWKNCLIPVDSKTPAVRPEQLNPFLYILKAD